MAKSLVVVESPAKAKTINKYLGRDYKVIASMGHIRDLPKSKLGVDVDDDFEPSSTSRSQSRKKVHQGAQGRREGRRPTSTSRPTPTAKARRSAGTSRRSSRARSGRFHRLMFNEITKKAVQEALKHPRDHRREDGRRAAARRVLDRLVGYKISPLLWDKVRRGLSAGRVQSVALKLICDREREIEKFVPEEYWHVFARLAGPQPPEFDAKLLKKGGDDHQGRATRTSRRRSSPTSSGATWTVSSVDTKERKRNAAPPFITSKLQQTARFPVKKTMMLAQQLYEGGIELPGRRGRSASSPTCEPIRCAWRTRR